MKLFVVEFNGVYLSGYGLILAPDEDAARQMIPKNGLDGYKPEDSMSVIDITDKLRKSGDRYLIWDGDY